MIDPEGCYRYSNGQFKIVAGRGKGQRGGFGIVGAQPFPHPKQLKRLDNASVYSLVLL